MGLLDFFRDPKDKPKAIAVTAAIGAGVLLSGYWFWTMKQRVSEGRCPFTGKSKSEEGFQCPITKLASSSNKKYETFKENHLEHIFSLKKDCIAEDKAKYLSYANLTGIQLLAVDVTLQDLRQLLKLQREKRRQIKDKKEYERYVAINIKEIESIFKANVNTILKDFGISKDTYDASIQEHIKTDTSIHMVGTHLYRVLVSRLDSLADPEVQTNQKTLEILNFIIQEYPKIQYKAEHVENLAEVKESMILDKVHEKYQLEEEDLQLLRRKFDNQEIGRASCRERVLMPV